MIWFSRLWFSGSTEWNILNDSWWSFALDRCFNIARLNLFTRGAKAGIHICKVMLSVSRLPLPSTHSEFREAQRYMLNPFVPGNFAKMTTLKLFELFSGHCQAIMIHNWPKTPFIIRIILAFCCSCKISDSKIPGHAQKANFRGFLV